MLAEEDPLRPESCARKLAALASPQRLQIVLSLCAGPRSVAELAGLLGAAPVNLTHHLRVLLSAGLLARARRGRFLDYRLADGLLLRSDGCLRLDLGCCHLELPAHEQASQTGAVGDKVDGGSPAIALYVRPASAGRG